MREGGSHTWIDVIEKDGSYFHPVGRGWPSQPPNYVAFRYRGRVRSVHRVESYEIFPDVSKKNRLWISTDSDHFVYKLGPAMRPRGAARGHARRHGQTQRARLVRDRHLALRRI